MSLSSKPTVSLTCPYIGSDTVELLDEDTPRRCLKCNLKKGRPFTFHVAWTNCLSEYSVFHNIFFLFSLLSAYCVFLFLSILRLNNIDDHSPLQFCPSLRSQVRMWPPSGISL